VNKKYIENYLFLIKEKLLKNLSTIILAVLFVLVGIVLGIILSVGGNTILKVLSSQDQTMSYYVYGSADISAIFFNRLFIYIFALMVIFVFCLHYYSSFLSLIYITYQSMIFAIGVSSLIDYHGVIGILLSIFFAVPINLLLLLLLVIEYVICLERAKTCQKYKLKFAHSFANNFWLDMLSILIIALIILVVANLIYPLVFRGILIINY